MNIDYGKMNDKEIAIFNGICMSLLGVHLSKQAAEYLKKAIDIHTEVE